MFRELAQRRQNMRLRDIEESRQLLWELTTYEPTLLHCLTILESTCLSQVLNLTCCLPCDNATDFAPHRELSARYPAST